MNVSGVHLFEPHVQLHQKNSHANGKSECCQRRAHTFFIITVVCDVFSLLSFLLWQRVVKECVFIAFHIKPCHQKAVGNREVNICSASISMQFVRPICIISFSWRRRLIVHSLIAEYLKIWKRHLSFQEREKYKKKKKIANIRISYPLTSSLFIASVIPCWFHSSIILWAIW